MYIYLKDNVDADAFLDRVIRNEQSKISGALNTKLTIEQSMGNYVSLVDGLLISFFCCFSDIDLAAAVLVAEGTDSQKRTEFQDTEGNRFYFFTNSFGGISLVSSCYCDGEFLLGCVLIFFTVKPCFPVPCSVQWELCRRTLQFRMEWLQDF